MGRAMTELVDLIHERAAQRVKEGRRPSRADIEWLEAVHERTPPSSSVELSRNAKGETQITVKVAHADPLVAESIAADIYTRQRGMWPMNDGTVGSEKRTPGEKLREAAAITRNREAKP